MDVGVEEVLADLHLDRDHACNALSANKTRQTTVELIRNHDIRSVCYVAY